MIKKEQAQAKGIKTTDGSKPLTNDKNERLEALKKLAPHLINSDGQLDVNALQDFINISQTTSNNRGYELTFAGKGIARAKADTETPLELKAEKTQSKNFDDTENVVIRGDNLDVLKILKQNYFEKIKMIYIDPPYNTKSENFVYNDNFKQSEAELIENLGLEERTTDFLQNVYGTRSHSGWLAFMYPRLKLARDLLKDDGVIFISIDDNEQANLKILCDEIFGEDNFLMDLIRKTKSTTNDAREGINIQHENCLVYCKSRQNINLLGGEKDLSNYKNPDNDPNGEWISDNPSAKSGNASNYFEIKNPHTGKIDLPPKGRFWIWSEKSIQKHIDNGTICFKKEHKENERGFIYKRHKKNLKTIKKTFDSLAFTDNQFMNQRATKNLLALGMAEYFTYPKGFEYIYKMIEHATENDDIILDFFAGSGTTGDAVMQLNAEDGGNRKFILVQWDEVIKEKTEAYKFCRENNFKPFISSITIERLNRAGEKIKNETQFSDHKKLDIGYKVFSLTQKPTLAEKGKLFVVEHQRQDTANKLYNMLTQSGKPLHTPIKELKKDVLYLVGTNRDLSNQTAENEQEKALYLLGEIRTEDWERITGDKQIALDECQIFIDGWADISLERWLNLFGMNEKGADEDRVVVVY